MKIILALLMIAAISGLAYFNHKANVDSIAAAKAAQEHVPFQPFNPAQKRMRIPSPVTTQDDIQFERANSAQEPTQVAAHSASTSSFTCDGRTHCSHMRSCEEATFFIQHCPNTSMDGDGDGIPCEKQWC